jgi:methylmalonyl-CoA mutase N-terminal domain/subunit
MRQILSQHFQESGGNNAQALAVEMAMLRELCSLLVNERGLDFDDVAFLPYELVSVGARFFEEIAKIRALRRMWAKMAKETFKAKKEKSCQLLISVHTSGRTMTYQQPLNNIARCAIETLAEPLQVARPSTMHASTMPMQNPRHWQRGCL